MDAARQRPIEATDEEISDCRAFASLPNSGYEIRECFLQSPLEGLPSYFHIYLDRNGVNTYTGSASGVLNEATLRRIAYHNLYRQLLQNNMLLEIYGIK